MPLITYFNTFLRRLILTFMVYRFFIRHIKPCSHAINVSHIKAYPLTNQEFLNYQKLASYIHKYLEKNSAAWHASGIWRILIQRPHRGERTGNLQSHKTFATCPLAFRVNCLQPARLCNKSKPTNKIRKVFACNKFWGRNSTKSFVWSAFRSSAFRYAIKC